MPGIFLSYARETKSAAKTLSDDIERLGYDTWFDQDLNGGRAWWDQILAQIRDCEIFVLALSPGSLGSEACGRECGYAEALGKPILPIMVADGVGVLPPRLSKIQYVDYRKRDIDAHAALVNALKEAPPAAALPQQLPEPPAIPMSYLEGIAGQIDSNAPLSIKDQSDIVSQLRSGLDDPESAAGARELLVRFSKKPDLYARTAREIDTLLRSALPPVLSPPPGEMQPSPHIKPISVVPDAKPGRSGRVRPAVFGAIVGGVLGVIAFIMDGVGGADAFVFLFALIPAGAGAIAGAVGARSMRVIGCAVAGTVLAAIAFMLVDDLMSREWLSVMVVLVMPPGTILGAILGAFVKKARGWP